MTYTTDLMYVIALLVSFEDISHQIGLGTANLKSSVINFINVVLGLLAIIALGFFLVGAFDYLISGKSDRVVAVRARRIMISSIVGMVVVLFSWAIVNYVIKTASNVTGAA